MMIKILISIILCLSVIASPCWAQDYWVYVNLDDKSGLLPEDDPGRAKRGDIVQILPVCSQFVPSEKEKKKMMIFKTSDLTKEEILEWESDWKELIDITNGNEHYEKKAFRRNRLKLEELGVSIKKGLIKDKIDKAKIKKDIKVKTITDLNIYKWKRKRFAYLIRPFQQLCDTVLPNAYAADDVNTINKSGEDYNTLTLWETNEDGTLTTKEVAHCYDDDGTLSDDVSIDGSTTTTSYYMEITAPVGERHDGTEGAGFILSNGVTDVLYVQDNYTRISWIQVAGAWREYGSSYNIRIGRDHQAIIHNCIVRDANAGSGRSAYGISFDRHNHVYNCIVYNIKTTGIVEEAGYGAGSDVYNCTSEQGIGFSTSQDGNCKNNIASSFGFSDTVHDYNASVDASANGGNSIANITLETELLSLSGGSEDLHLETDSQLIDEGVDLGDGVFDTDIDNRDRDTEGDTWDIGADEIVAAAPEGRRVFLISKTCNLYKRWVIVLREVLS